MRISKDRSLQSTFPLKSQVNLTTLYLMSTLLFSGGKRGVAVHGFAVFPAGAEDKKVAFQDLTPVLLASGSVSRLFNWYFVCLN